MVQTWWQKLNPNERMAATGAVVVFIVSLLSTSWISIIGSAIVIATYWLKYSPNQTINWPAPIELINVVIAGILAFFAAIAVLFALGIGSFGLGMIGSFGGFFGGGIYLLLLAGVIAFAVGAGMMFIGTWREYQAMPKAPMATSASTPPPPPASPSAPPPAPAAPPSASSATPSEPPGEPPAG